MPPQLLAFLNHGLTKAIAILSVVAAVAFGAYIWHRNGYNSGYRAGYAQSLKDNPPNVYTGTTTVNQQPCPAPDVYGINIGKLGIGIVYKK